jgi:Cu-Zn family superoxide dismutase
MRIHVLAALLTCGVLGACNPPPPEPKPTSPEIPPPTASMPAPAASVSLSGVSGQKVGGQLKLAASHAGVRISGELTGFSADTGHGLHVHEFGDCSAPDAHSAGEHFNPEHTPHGSSSSGIGKHHLGDLPNVAANAEGRAQVDVMIADATLGDGGTHDVVGKAIVVHAMPDDYLSQPSGNSGTRIACGVIRMRT